MTYKSELDFARQAAEAFQNAAAWRWQALNCGNTAEENARRERINAVAKGLTLQGRLAMARADSIKERREGGKVSYCTQEEIRRVSAIMEADL